MRSRSCWLLLVTSQLKCLLLISAAGYFWLQLNCLWSCRRVFPPKQVSLLSKAVAVQTIDSASLSFRIGDVLVLIPEKAVSSREHYGFVESAPETCGAIPASAVETDLQVCIKAAQTATTIQKASEDLLAVRAPWPGCRIW